MEVYYKYGFPSFSVSGLLLYWSNLYWLLQLNLSILWFPWIAAAHTYNGWDSARDLHSQSRCRGDRAVCICPRWRFSVLLLGITWTRHQSRLTCWDCSLNRQHEFLLEVYGNNLIHPSIPTENLQSVADIATGTGYVLLSILMISIGQWSNELNLYRIWLRDAATVLCTRNCNPSSPYYLHGFDISSAQFQPVPTQTNAEISFSIQNCLESFPVEHHGRYDLVHVRLLVGALRKNEYHLAIKNIFDLLSMDQWPSRFKVLVADSMQNQMAICNGKK